MLEKDSLELEIFKVGNSIFKNYCYFIHRNMKGLLIDPAWEYDRIVSFVKGNSIQLKGILLTHSHIDHVDLAEQIALEYKIPVYMSKEEIDYYQFNCFNLTPVHNMTKMPFDDISVIPILTPGHTKGSVCYLIDDLLFSGDTLFMEGCGECTGLGASATDLFNSLSFLKDVLPSNTKVFPGHSFGELPGKTIDYLLKNNIYFQIDKVEQFVKYRMRRGQKSGFSFS